MTNYRCTSVDQHGHQRTSPQTNLAGDTHGPVLSGEFQGPVAAGAEAEAVDLRGATGVIYKPAGPVTQYFADHVTVITNKATLPVPAAPPPPPHFVDREIELRKLANRLIASESAAVIALHGMGGTGKSALVKKLADELTGHFPGGILWTALGPLPDPFHILESWALVAGGDVRTQTGLLDRAAAVRALLASRDKMFVVLDDVWEYECPELLMRHALPAAAVVLITTRDADLGKRLRCQVERIDVLPQGGALALLEKLLGSLGEYESAAHEVARLVGYAPLALELAAGLADDPSDLPQIASQLRARPTLGILRLGAGDQRQESIEASLSLSYAALDPDSQRRFRSLGAFALAPFGVAAAAAVWDMGTHSEALEKADQVLRGLARKSLLSRQEGGNYSQHGLLRAYALALLEREGEMVAARRRHALHYLALAQTSNWRVIETVFNQVRHGWEATIAYMQEQVVEYLLALMPFLKTSGRWDDLIASVQYALEHAPQAQSSGIRGQLLNEMGFVHWLRGECTQALDCLGRALNLCREAGDREQEGFALNYIGVVHRTEGNLDEAIAHFQQSLAIRQEMGDRGGEGIVLRNIGMTYRQGGRYIEALDFCQRATLIIDQVGHREGQALCAAALGVIYRAMGQYEEALRHMQQSLTMAREDGDRNAEADMLDTLADVYRFKGEYGRALEFYRQSLEMAQELGSLAGQAYAIGDIGDVFFAQGEYSRALEQYQKALDLWRVVGDRKREASLLDAIACVHRAQGENDRAMDLLQCSLTLRRQVGDRAGEGRALNHIGSVHLSRKEFDRASDYFRQSLIIAQETGARPGEGAVLNNIGLTHAGREEYAQALDDFQRSLMIAQQLDEPAEEGFVWQNIGHVYQHLAQAEKAETALARASAIAGQLGCVYGDGVRRWYE